MARVLVAMSGGVDSSIAAASLVEEGHEVVGVTMKLWGGPSDSGCCSVSDVDDARAVASQLGITHRVFNFSSDFDEQVVNRYVEEHRSGRTPNPCIECNRHIKFDRLLERATRLGFDAVATGHHARVVEDGGRWRLLRGADHDKDQSYVLSVLGQRQLSRVVLPVGEMTKDAVRARAVELGLRTASKPDSQEVCFITAGASGRAAFLRERLELHQGRVVDAGTGVTLQRVPAVELVTVGQRRGLGSGGGGPRRYALEVDVEQRRVVVAPARALRAGGVKLRALSWVDRPLAEGARVEVQSSAHGRVAEGVFEGGGVRFGEPQKRTAPGQTVALYAGDAVLGSGIAC